MASLGRTVISAALLAGVAVGTGACVYVPAAGPYGPPPARVVVGPPPPPVVVVPGPGYRWGRYGYGGWGWRHRYYW